LVLVIVFNTPVNFLFEKRLAGFNFSAFSLIFLLQHTLLKKIFFWDRDMRLGRRGWRPGLEFFRVLSNFF